MWEVFRMNLVGQTCFLGTVCVLIADTGGVAFTVFDKVICQSTAVIGRTAVDQRQIMLAESFTCQLMVQILRCSGTLGKYQDAGYRLIQSVNDCQVWRRSMSVR